MVDLDSQPSQGHKGEVNYPCCVVIVCWVWGSALGGDHLSDRDVTLWKVEWLMWYSGGVNVAIMCGH